MYVTKNESPQDNKFRSFFLRLHVVSLVIVDHEVAVCVAAGGIN